MRIISLSPAITAWLQRIGNPGTLVGCTHLCPAETAADSSVVTTARAGAAEPDPDSGASDPFRSSWKDISVDIGRVAALSPDLLLGGEPSEWSAGPWKHFPFAPQTFKQVLDRVLELGRLTGRLQEAMRLIALEERRLPRRETDAPGGPGAVLLCSVEPMMSGGYWSADLLELAGMEPRLTHRGQPPRQISLDDIREAQPDRLVCFADQSLEGVNPAIRVALGPVDRLLWPGPQLYELVHALAAAAGTASRA